ncbi:hypothetical protein JOC83_001787 [Bacillus iocasae]|uniref:Uncharacterized protein n=1 Tax=Priestia iocasae TaxID=2291674 RepID=A0ABS2QTY9_9BACI|nr:hypothetical protein [Metabacillus iocasae]
MNFYIALSFQNKENVRALASLLKASDDTDWTQNENN